MWLLASVILGLFVVTAGASPGCFTFAGLSLGTTVDDLKKRYPNSSMVGSYMYVADADSHDHIYGIEIPGPSPGGRLRLVFERPRERVRDDRPRFPSCEQILTALQRMYGFPAKVEEFAEERSKNRRVSWSQDGEVLSLQCFRSSQGAFLAEALTISASRP